MIKFWKEDFKYTNRTIHIYGHLGLPCYCYEFDVHGESANYLMNTYQLNYPYVHICLFTINNNILVSSRGKSKAELDHSKEVKEEDLQELLSILQEEVNKDSVNYEEYLCNSDYYKRDSRWM